MEDDVVDAVHIIIPTCEDCPSGKVIIRRKRKLVNSRIDCFDERIQSVFWALEVIWKCDVTIWMIWVLAMTNLQIATLQTTVEACHVEL